MIAGLWAEIATGYFPNMKESVNHGTGTFSKTVLPQNKETEVPVTSKKSILAAVVINASCVD
jgi:hypothetical protein